MIWIKFAGASAAMIYGSCTVFNKKTPLFYKIVYFAMASGWMGSLYQLLGEMFMPYAVEGFHVGYFGYIGMFFFLLSSYYGSIDSLADSGERCYQKYRIAASVIPLLMIVGTIWGVLAGNVNMKVLTVIWMVPLTGTAYYSGKHLIMPDVEHGIIAVMRLYNAVIMLLCVMQCLLLLLPQKRELEPVLEVSRAVLLGIALPMARKGVHKWFI